MIDSGESRLDKVRARQKKMRRIALLVVIVLAVGLVAGAGGNLLFGKPKAAKVSSAGKNAKKTAESTTPSEEEQERTQRGPATPQFSASVAMAHTFALSDQIGPRAAGSVKESAAADYIVSKLGEYGYTVEEQPFTMADGFASRNIVGTRRGTTEGYTLVIGAHYDSQRDSKGAVDNASGVGTVLELARDFAGRRLDPTLQFVFFGANRPGSTEQDIRLVGSRRYVELTGSLEKKDIIGVIAVDSVGQGEVLALRTLGTGLQRLKDKLATFAAKKNTPVTYIKSDTDSDNIPFENSQIPAVWVEWCDQGGSLSTDNSYASVVAQKVQAVGVLIESFVLGLNSQDMEELKY
ncbi:MAG: M28 family peptidase [Candidatus Geothermincolia bacterium]